MNTQPRYIAHQPDSNGYINYSEQEHEVWHKLYTRQIELIKDRACTEYIQGISKLGLTPTRIPQPPELSKNLQRLTGWAVESVAALIDINTFFRLLAEKKFPAASFIRRLEDIDYLPEPDIFHEVFGHCPALSDPYFAAFTHEIGKFGSSLAEEDRIMLERLYWFTVEFGLITTPHGLRIYGAGILSSKTETIYALESNIPIRKPFNLIEVMRTPYRYDQLQTTYFIIDSFAELYNTVKDNKLQTAFAQAKARTPLDELPTLGHQPYRVKSASLSR